MKSIFVLTMLFISTSFFCAENESFMIESRQKEKSDDGSELLEYLDTHKILYNKDWDEATFNEAFAKTVSYIQSMTQEDAQTLAYKIHKNLLKAREIHDPYVSGTRFWGSLTLFALIVEIVSWIWWANTKLDEEYARFYRRTSYLIGLALGALSSTLIFTFLDEQERRLKDLYPGKSFFNFPEQYYVPLLEKLCERAPLSRATVYESNFDNQMFDW